MIGVFRKGKDHYLSSGPDWATLKERAKSRRHELLCTVPDEKADQAQFVAARQSEALGGSVIEDAQ